MQYIITISEEIFDQIRDHETDRVSLESGRCKELTGKEEPPYFTPMDDLKIYREGEIAEAVRLAVVEEKEEENRVLVRFEMQEWMINIEMEIDRQIAEEQELLRLYGVDPV